jgi:hypothetical protein
MNRIEKSISIRYKLIPYLPEPVWWRQIFSYCEEQSALRIKLKVCAGYHLKVFRPSGTIEAEKIVLYGDLSLLKRTSLLILNSAFAGLVFAIAGSVRLGC